MALHDGNTKAEEVGYINAHGTSTQVVYSTGLVYWSSVVEVSE